MERLKASITLETAFGPYVITEIIGEGGAGRVYGGTGLEGEPIALKVLSDNKATREKRSRFKNEIAFLVRNKHKNVVTVLDHGVSVTGSVKGPFYVMPRYQGSLRKLIAERIKPEAVLPLFSQILDGVEAAHFQGVVHRDLKPENILIGKDLKTPVVADFGIAKFTEDIVATTVLTAPSTRLANFQYAAPEQRAVGLAVGTPADIYALGLILNEMFTGVVPNGTDYKTIAGVSAEFGFLDEIVAQMIRQQPQDRPGSIALVKGLMAVQALAEEPDFMGAVQSAPQAVSSAPAHRRPLQAPPRGETVSRRARCGSPARRDLRGAWGSDSLGLPDPGLDTTTGYVSRRGGLIGSERVSLAIRN